jgi:hypothetical protein
MKVDALPLITLNERHTNPNACKTVGPIPLFNLKFKRFALCGRKPQILSHGLGFSEVEKIFMKPDKQGEV